MMDNGIALLSVEQCYLLFEGLKNNQFERTAEALGLNKEETEACRSDLLCVLREVYA